MCEIHGANLPYTHNIHVKLLTIQFPSPKATLTQHNIQLIKSPFCLSISSRSSCSLAFNRKEAMLELLLSTSGGLAAVEDPGDSGGDAVNSWAGSLGRCAAEMLASSVWKELAEG